MSTYHTKKQRLSTEAAIATISTDGALIPMIQNNTHLTLHAYLKTNSDAYEVTNMWDVDVVVPKRNADRILKIENPWHHHKEKVTLEGQRKERKAPLRAMAKSFAQGELKTVFEDMYSEEIEQRELNANESTEDT